MKRIVLLKLSGEALSRVNGIGIDMEKVEDVAYEVKSLKDTGVSVGIVRRCWQYLARKRC